MKAERAVHLGGKGAFFDCGRESLRKENRRNTWIVISPRISFSSSFFFKSGFTLLALDLPSTCTSDLQPQPVLAMMQLFGWDDMVCPQLVSRYLSHLIENRWVVWNKSIFTSFVKAFLCFDHYFAPPHFSFVFHLCWFWQSRPWGVKLWIVFDQGRLNCNLNCEFVPMLSVSVVW